MQKVEYVYKGSDSRKLVVSGNEAVIIQGDNESTEFDFRFPEEYKTYSKQIDWNFQYESEEKYPVLDEKGQQILNPDGTPKIAPILKPAIFNIVDNKFKIPAVVIEHYAGRQAKFNIIFTGPIDENDNYFREVSLPEPVYVTKASTLEYGKDYEDIVTILASKALTDAKFKIDYTKFRPKLTFQTAIGGTVEVEMQLPYLNKEGIIDEIFLPDRTKINTFSILWDGLTSEKDIPVDNASAAVVYVEDSTGNSIYPAVQIVDKNTIKIKCNHKPKDGTEFLVKVIGIKKRA